MTWIAQNWALGIWISRHLSAEQALTAALESISFDPDTPGIEDAALRYMRVPLRQLDLPQVAALVALAQAPSAFRRDPEKWRNHRDWLLRAMQQQGAIAQADLDEALARPLLPADWQVRPR